MDGDRPHFTDQLVDALAPVLRRLREETDERLTALEVEFSARMVEATERLREIINESRHRAEDAITASADAVRQLAADVRAEASALPDRMLAQAALLPRPKDGKDGRDGFIKDVHAHIEGHTYDAGECATWRGGLWQAVECTASEPGPEDQRWRLLADGIAKFIGETDADYPRNVTLIEELASGAQHVADFELPLWLHRGTYSSDATYVRGDVVSLDGSAFVCTAEKATTSPPSGEWRLVAQRGGRGRVGADGPKGEQGEKGDPGPRGAKGERGDRGERGLGIVGVRPLDDRHWQLQYEDNTVSEPINLPMPQFAGTYSPGEWYERGDLVRLGYHIWLCLERTQTAPSAENPAWALFLPGVETSGVGEVKIDLPLHYRGTWQVAFNVPDLITRDNEHGDIWHCVTDDPDVGEIADGALPGIGGTTIFNNDWIIFNETVPEWEHVKGHGLTKPEADQFYVQKIGDDMSGDLIFPETPALGIPTAGVAWGASTARFAINVGFRTAAQQVLMLQQPGGRMDDGVYVSDPLGNTALILTERTGVQKAGDTMLGALNMDEHPLAMVRDPVDPQDAVNLRTLDDRISSADEFVRKTGDTMTGNLTITRPVNQDAVLRLTGEAFTNSIVDLWNNLFDSGFRFELRTGGNVNDIGLLLRRFFNTETTILHVPLNQDFIELLRPRTVSGDPVDPNDLARRAYVDAAITNAVGNIDRFVHKAGDDLTGTLRWPNPTANGEIVNVRHGIIRMIGGAIDVQDDGGFGSEVRANWFVVPTDGRGLAFGPIGQDGGLYKAVGSGLRLRQSSGDQRIQIEPNDGSEQWDVLDQRGGRVEGGFQLHRAGSESVGGQQITWFDDTSDQARIFGSRFAGGDDLGSLLVQLARPDGSWTTAFRARQTLADAIPRIELAADPINPLDAATRQYVDRLVTGAPHFIGTIDAATGQCRYTQDSGLPDGPLVDPDVPVVGGFLICTNAGDHASLPDPMESGDWLVTDGNTWTVLHFGGGVSDTASNITVQPPIFGQPNVQLALEETETRVTANELAINQRVVRTGDVMTGFLTLHADPTNPLHATTRQYVDTSLGNLRLPTWTQGANYTVGQTLYWDGLPFVVVTAIVNAPATPNFTTIRLAVASQGDYWRGVPQGWATDNWVHLATVPAGGSYRMHIDSLENNHTGIYILDISTTYTLGRVTIASMCHYGSGIFKAFRLSAQGGTWNNVRLEGLFSSPSTSGQDMKLIISGFSGYVATNQTTIPKPPTGQAANLGGTEYQLLHISTTPVSGFVTSSVQVNQGGWVKFPHVNATNADDGRISARLHSPGLNIVGVTTETTGTETGRQISMYGDVRLRGATDRLVAPRGVECTADNWGYQTNGGGWFYKASGTGVVIRQSSGNQQPQIEDNSGATNTRRFILDSRNTQAIAEPTADGHMATRGYVNTRETAIGGLLNGKVNRTGDTLTGGLGFGSTTVNDLRDVSRHIALWATGTNGYGLNMTADHLNIVAASNAAAAIGFAAGTATTRVAEINTNGLTIHRGGITVQAGNLRQLSTSNGVDGGQVHSWMDASSRVTGEIRVSQNGSVTGTNHQGSLEFRVNNGAGITRVAYTRYGAAPRLALDGDPINPEDVATRRYVDNTVLPTGVWENHALNTATGFVITGAQRGCRSRLLFGGTLCQFQCEMTLNSDWTSNASRTIQQNTAYLPVAKRPPLFYVQAAYCSIGGVVYQVRLEVNPAGSAVIRNTSGGTIPVSPTAATVQLSVIWSVVAE